MPVPSASSATPLFLPSEEDYYREMLACNPIDFVGGVAPTPLLIIHGDGDETVPVEEAYRLYDAASEPRELFIVKGGAHKLRLNPDAMDKAVGWTLQRLGLHAIGGGDPEYAEAVEEHLARAARQEEAGRGELGVVADDAVAVVEDVEGGGELLEVAGEAVGRAVQGGVPHQFLELEDLQGEVRFLLGGEQAQRLQ